MIQQLLRSPPTNGEDAVLYGEALQEVAQHVFDEKEKLQEARLQLEHERRGIQDLQNIASTRLEGIRSLQGTDLRDVPQALRTIQAALTSLNIPEAPTLFTDVEEIKVFLAALYAFGAITCTKLGESELAQRSERAEQQGPLRALCDGLSRLTERLDGIAGPVEGTSDSVERLTRVVNYLSEQLRHTKVSVVSSQVDCRDAVLASVGSLKREVSEISRIQSGEKDHVRVLNALTHKVQSMCSGELAAIFDGVNSVAEVNARVCEDGKRILDDVLQLRQHLEASNSQEAMYLEQLRGLSSALTDANRHAESWQAEFNRLSAKHVEEHEACGGTISGLRAELADRNAELASQRVTQATEDMNHVKALEAQLQDAQQANQILNEEKNHLEHALQVSELARSALEERSRTDRDRLESAQSGFRDEQKKSSELDSNLATLCVLVDETKEEVQRYNQSVVDGQTIARLRAEVAEARALVAGQNETRRALKDLIQENNVAVLERHELESLRGQVANMRAELADKNEKLIQQKDRLARWDMEMTFMADDRSYLKDKVAKLKRRLRESGLSSDEPGTPLEEPGTPAEEEDRPIEGS